MNNYIFDVDGTLTPSRMRMDTEFQAEFIRFCKSNNVYLVTGSDYPKTLEQVGEDVMNAVTKSFNCSGNSVWVKGVEVYRTEWKLPQAARTWLNQQLNESKFYRKTGLHIEERPGMVNFSIVGRNCNIEERAMYRQWDEHKNERVNISRAFEEKFEGMKAQVAGETGLDIYPIGSDKGQVASVIEKPITFFGDMMQRGGNDYPLARALEPYEGSGAVQVKDWKDTRRILFALQNKGLHEFVGVV